MSRVIPRLVLSARTTLFPVTKLRTFTPDPNQLQGPEVAPNMDQQQQTQYEDLNQQSKDSFTDVPDTNTVQVGSYPDSPFGGQSFQDSAYQAEGFQGEFSQGYGQFDQFSDPADALAADLVDLPQKPVEMPDLIVEQAPGSMGRLRRKCVLGLNAFILAFCLN